MRHQIDVRAHGFRLRPVTEADAAFIVVLRNAPHAAGKIGDTAKTVEDQQAWLRRQADVENDYLFIIEKGEKPEPCGMLGIYGIEGNVGEWGRWVIQPGVPAAAASALLALEICFERLGLETVRALIVSSNQEVVSFHRRIGYEYVGTHPDSRTIGGHSVSMTEFRATRSTWPRIRERLDRHAVAAFEWMRSTDAARRDQP